MHHNRRNFLGLLAAASVSSRYRALGEARNQTLFRFALISDTHVIDTFYRGPEGVVPEDNTSIVVANQNFVTARDSINALRPSVDFVLHAGDIFHNYPSGDTAFYYNTKTRVDIAKSIIDGFRCPVHVGFGNHDYGVPLISREVSNRLFQDKFGVQPYYSFEHQGHLFIVLNSMLGYSWDPGHPEFNPSLGSFGEAQLHWFEAELARGKPAIVVVHYPLSSVCEFEKLDYGIYSILRRSREQILCVFAGHWHRWIDFGNTFGPKHIVVAATRYDPKAILVAEISVTGHLTIVNESNFVWGTHRSL